MKKYKINIYTFLVVLVTVMVVGYIGIYFGLNYMEEQYIRLQIDINKRQAETMGRLLESRIESGEDKHEVMMDFQNAIQGTETEKGFQCVFDSEKGTLLCHPNPEMLRMQLPETFHYTNYADNSEMQTTDMLKKGEAVGGLFHTDQGTDITYMVPIGNTGFMLSAHENIAQIKTQVAAQERIYLLGFVVIGLAVAFFSVVPVRLISRRYEKRIEEKNVLLEKNNRTLTEQKEEIEAQNNTLTEQKEEIEAGIHYASRIQSALLPPSSRLKKGLGKHFIFWRPRDIVSGDFYWMKQIGQSTVFAVADSTGHGVPGAFMSMLGIAGLNEIVASHDPNSAEIKTGSVLDKLRNKIIDSVYREEDAQATKDGMDMSLILIDRIQRKLKFTGAYMPGYLVRNGEIHTIEADKMPVGVHKSDQVTFSEKEIEIMSGDMFYMASDGFQDQFGGEKNKKYLKKRFRSFLLNLASEDIETQKQRIAQEFETWKGHQKQVDDVLVSGIRI